MPSSRAQTHKTLRLSGWQSAIGMLQNRQDLGQKGGILAKKGLKTG
jgi:hypothetical protein